MKPRCILICVGSELLRGKLNTHASHISRRLASIGLSLNEENTVSDALPEITAAIRRGLQHFDVVIVSGGLGPTFDDLTREAAATATGRLLSPSPALLRGIAAKFKRARYRHMPKANARQAYVLHGASPIENKNGTAPGQWLPLDSRVLILLPGPPRELYPMLETVVLPRLKKTFPRPPQAEAHLHFVNVPESVIDDKVRPIVAREQGGADHAEFTILAHLGLVDLDVFVTSASAARAKAALSRIVKAVHRAAGKFWYGSDAGYPLEKVVGDHFRKHRMTLAAAESCTGGLLAKQLTDIAGSSDYFVQGWVTYANSAKMQALGVPATLLKEHGAVSKPVALAMADGARALSGATWGVGITGVAGPGGGSPNKPVGLVYIAFTSKNRRICHAYRFLGGRDAVRQRAVLNVLDRLRKI